MRASSGNTGKRDVRRETSEEGDDCCSYLKKKREDKYRIRRPKDGAFIYRAQQGIGGKTALALPETVHYSFDRKKKGNFRLSEFAHHKLKGGENMVILLSEKERGDELGRGSKNWTLQKMRAGAS